MSMRAKMVLSTITHHTPSSDDSCNVQLTFTASYAGPDNDSWSKWTPQGEIKMTVTNPAAVEFLKIGKSYYVDFTEAP